MQQFPDSNIESNPTVTSDTIDTLLKENKVVVMTCVPSPASLESQLHNLAIDKEMDSCSQTELDEYTTTWFGKIDSTIDKAWDLHGKTIADVKSALARTFKAIVGGIKAPPKPKPVPAPAAAARRVPAIPPSNCRPWANVPMRALPPT